MHNQPTIIVCRTQLNFNIQLIFIILLYLDNILLENQYYMNLFNKFLLENQYEDIEETLSLGQAKFKSNLKRQNIRKYLRKMLQQKSWKTKLNKASSSLFQEMIESNAEQLSLDSPFNYFLVRPLQQIVNINFYQLKILQINKLKLTNIQDFCELKMPQLQILNMSFNNVCRLKSLNKLQLKNLRMLAVDHNPVIQMGSMKWSNNNLNELKINKINIFQYQNNHVIDQDMSSLLRLKSKDQMKFWIRSTFRIKLHKIKEMMKKRYEKIELDE